MAKIRLMPYLGGLVSVSFRKLEPSAIVNLVAQADLKAIEWGGDIHVPHGDIASAKAVAALTADAGLAMANYGSYYRLGVSEQEGLNFQRVLETAHALGAPSIRVWAGHGPSADTDEAQRKTVTEDALRCAELAGQTGIKVALEYHNHTLTDCDASAMRLLNEARHPNLYTLWQPINHETVENNIVALTNVLPRLLHLHIFYWEFPDGVMTRRPLADGEAAWSKFLKLAVADDERYVLMEFVKDDDPEQFLRDAATLKSWLNAC